MQVGFGVNNDRRRLAREPAEVPGERRPRDAADGAVDGEVDVTVKDLERIRDSLHEWGLTE